MPERKIEIKAFQGVDLFSNWNVGHVSRPAFAENARSVQGGSIEKRDGSERYGTIALNAGDRPVANLGLFLHPNDSTFAASGLYRFFAYDPVGSRTRRTLLLYLNPSDAWTPFSAVLPSDNVVTADSATDKIYRHEGFSSNVSDSFSSPAAGLITCTYPSTGNAVTSDTVTGKIYVHLGFSSTVTDSFSSPAASPSGLAMHASGDLLSMDATSDKIYRHDGVTSTVEDSFSSPSTVPQGLAVTPAGNVVSADDNTNKIYVHAGFSSTVSTSFSSPSTNPTGLSVDISGNLVSCDSSTDKIYRHSGVTSSILDSFSSPSTAPTSASSGYDAQSYEFQELGASDTYLTVTQVTTGVYRYSRVAGTPLFALFKVTPGCEVQIASANLDPGNVGTFTVVARGNDWFDVLNSSGVAEANKNVGIHGHVRTELAEYSTVEAEGVTMAVNGVGANFSILKTGYPLVSLRDPDDPLSSQAHYVSHFNKAPTAEIVNYYKGKLYLANIRDSANGTVEPERFGNHVAQSSPLLGIVALVEEDLDAGATEIDISDTKYVFADGDKLDVYRGGTLIDTLTVTGKTELAISVESTSAALQGADEIWLHGTKTGLYPKVFRWPDSVHSGVDVSRWDTFPLSGGSNGDITMMTNVGDVMAIANEDNFGFWNDYSMRALDGGYGCVSKRGFAKCLKRLFFVDYRGMYVFDGASEPRKISTPVDAIFRGASRDGLRHCAMGTKGYSVFAAVGDVVIRKDDGSVDRTIPDCCVEYDVIKDFWYVHSNVPASQFLKLN